MLRQNSVVEVLAPAGTYETVEAAVRCGADAVYLGGKVLNARRNAGNFSFEELKAAVEYCHARNTKVYLTLNTLATDNELKNEVQCAVRDACNAGIDALIVQDMGVFRLAKMCAPTMPIHASTQMSVHTLAGVKQLSEMGFSRAVLARELSLDEIEYIVKNSPIEIEVFVHGALCMCVSGQCLMSAMLGSRSANRGLCAQPCRLPFAAPGGTGNDLSLKDLSAVDYLGKLAEIGVKSLKIEGRMKRPEYVAAAVTACRKALKNENDEKLKDQLKGVFSRSGFTHGYLTGELGRNMFGIRRKDDVTAAQPVLKELAHLYEKETPRVGVDFMFCAYEGETASLSAKAGNKSAFVLGEVEAQPAQNVPLTEEKIRQQLEKCGGTPFFANSIEVDIDENISLPLSSINALRRAAFDKLYEELKRPYIHDFHSVNVENRVKKVKNPEFFARFSSFEQAKSVWENVEKIILPIKEAEKAAEKSAEKVVAELPRVFFGKEDALLKKLAALKEKGITQAACSTLDAVYFARQAGMKFMLSLGSNV
ncbi:MAG: U32 family peptidase, partial [Clostridia bacterium]|nr:U32 family peptidase [Clostridia bacterium]